jgi:Holliday junction resolvasome RuvABC endonuclease subunit
MSLTPRCACKQLPTLEEWYEDMHSRPVIIQTRKDKRLDNDEWIAGSVDGLNPVLKQDLELIGADSQFTAYGFRHMGIAEAGQAGANRVEIAVGAGQSLGAQTLNYDQYASPFANPSRPFLTPFTLPPVPRNSTSKEWILLGGGYRPDRPQQMAPYPRAVHTYVMKEDWTLVDMLIEKWRPDILQLEKKADANHEKAGERIRAWLLWVRHCLLSWVISCCMRPWTCDMRIDADASIKRHLLADVFAHHLEPIVGSDALSELEEFVRGLEDRYIALGDDAELDENGLKTVQTAAATHAAVAAIPRQVAEHMQPRLDEKASVAALTDETELRLDQGYYQGLLEDEQREFTYDLLPHQSPVGTQLLRDARLAHTARKEEVSRSYGGGMLKWISPPHAEPRADPRAGLRLRNPAPPAPSPSATEAPTPTVSPLPLEAPRHAASSSTLALALPFASPSTSTSAPPTAFSSTAIVASALPAVASSSTDILPSARPAASTAIVASASAESQEDRAKHAESLHSICTGVKSVPQMALLYTQHVMPLELGPLRKGRVEWRGSHAIGETMQGKWTDLLTKTYSPPLGQVMKYVDEGLDFDCAVDKVEAERGKRDFTGSKGFIAQAKLSKVDMSRAFAERFAKAAATSVRAAAVVPAEPPPAATVAPLVANAEAGVRRYLGIDPGLKCGWALLQVNAAGVLLSVDVGVLKVKRTSCIGTRMADLRRQLEPLFTPPPQHAFSEDFFAHPEHASGIAVTYALRGVVVEEFVKRSIPYESYKPQSWKLTSAGHGRAGKIAIKSALENYFGHAFPTKLPVGGAEEDFEDHASDATGIALCGVHKLHPELQIASTFRLSAPGQVTSLSRKRGRDSPEPPEIDMDTAASVVAAAAAAATEKMSPRKSQQVDD